MNYLTLSVVAGVLIVLLNPTTSSAMHIMEGFLPVKW